MSRILLIHWHTDEAMQRCEVLRRAGYEAEFRVPKDSSVVRRIAAQPPDAVVVDLSRRTVEGGGIAALLRQRKKTRFIPLVFVDGAGDKLERVRKMFPAEEFTDWRRIRSSIRRALRKPPLVTSVPGVLDGYSGTPLAKKLGIKAESTVALLGSPQDFEKKLGTLPAHVHIRNDARGRARLVVLFASSRAVLSRRFQSAVRILEEGGGLWIAWPKKTSGVAIDLTQNMVRNHGLQAGLVDYKICAIDEIWSGLLFTRRKRGGRSTKR